MPDDNYFWLDPGESKTVNVSDVRGLVTGALNAEELESGPANRTSGR